MKTKKIESAGPDQSNRANEKTSTETLPQAPQTVKEDEPSAESPELIELLRYQADVLAAIHEVLLLQLESLKRICSRIP